MSKAKLAIVRDVDATRPARVVICGKVCGRRRAGYTYHARLPLGQIGIYEDTAAPWEPWRALYWPRRFGGVGAAIGHGKTPQEAADAAARWIALAVRSLAGGDHG